MPIKMEDVHFPRRVHLIEIMETCDEIVRSAEYFNREANADMEKLFEKVIECMERGD